MHINKHNNPAIESKTSMKKAKSRLVATSTKDAQKPSSSLESTNKSSHTKTTTRLNKYFTPKKPSSGKLKKKLPVAAGQTLELTSANTVQYPSLFSTYIKRLPILFLSLPPLYFVTKILYSVHPNTIKHVLIPNTYTPLLVSFFFFSLFFWGFVLLKFYRGLIISMCVSTVLFLKLQQVILSIELISGIIIFFSTFFLLIEVLLKLSSKK